MVQERRRIYLDYAATTPIERSVLEAMFPFFDQEFGNPSSIHTFGQIAEAALENARILIAELINCLPEEITFTSGGSESDNLALRGTALMEKKVRNANHLLISPVEHHAVSETARQLAEWYGFKLEYLPVDAYGMVDPADVKKYLRSETAVVSVIFANNEIGSINPIAEIGSICREKRIPFHTDAVQAAAHLDIDVEQLNVDLLSIGAHKFYGPKGVGALYVRKGTPLLPTQTGGGQEFGKRAGTHNVPYIVGMAKALEMIVKDRQKDRETLTCLRDQVVETILERIPGVQLTGHPKLRLPNHASFVFEGVDGNTLLMLLDSHGIACSSGSACKSGDPKPSDVLLALGLSPQWALGSLRITVGRGTTQADIDWLLAVLPQLIEKSRNLEATSAI